jgi:hypothetical protein
VRRLLLPSGAAARRRHDRRVFPSFRARRADRHHARARERRHHPVERMEAPALRRAVVSRARRSRSRSGRATSRRRRCRWRASWRRSPTAASSTGRSS